MVREEKGDPERAISRMLGGFWGAAREPRFGFPLDGSSFLERLLLMGSIQQSGKHRADFFVEKTAALKALCSAENLGKSLFHLRG